MSTRVLPVLRAALLLPVLLGAPVSPPDASGATPASELAQPEGAWFPVFTGPALGGNPMEPTPGPARAGREGWPVTTGEMYTTSPAYGDFDRIHRGDEIIAGAGTGIYVMHADGSWMTGWDPYDFHDAAVHSPPSLGDLDGDGAAELVVAMNQFWTWRAYVAVLTPSGASFPGRWPITVGDGVTGSPVLADLDGDGTREILVACKDRMLYVWRHDGTDFRPGTWPKDLGGVLYRSPAVGRLDPGSGPKIVIGCTLDQTHRAILYVLNPDGTALNSHWPKRLEEGRIFTPTIADLDSDGKAEILIGASAGGLSTPGVIHAFREDGSEMGGAWPITISEPDEPWTGHGYPSAIAVGDLDPSYPGLEVVTAPNYNTRVYAFHADGTVVPGWPYQHGAGSLIGNAPILGDLDGMGGIEVVVGEGAQDCGGRYLFLIRGDATDLEGSPVQFAGFMQSGAALGDLDRNGKMEIYQAVSADGTIQRLELPKLTTDPDALAWPMQQHDACRTGCSATPTGGREVWEVSGFSGALRLDGEPVLLAWPSVARSELTLRLSVARPVLLDLEIFDVEARRIESVTRQRVVPAGTSTFPLRIEGPRNSGVYFARATVRGPDGIRTTSSRFVIAR